MRVLKHLFDKNKTWAEQITNDDPQFFTRLAGQQSPQYLWIGCADSRVPANQIIGLEPGEVFVHRNIANVVVHTDLNCLSVIQYAVEVLKVQHIIVCGHYGCGGIQAAMQTQELGLIDNWLRHLKDIYEKYASRLDRIEDTQKRFDHFCELNVKEQAYHICQTTIVQNAWKRGQQLSVHGWIYGLHDGLLQDLNICVTSPDELAEVYRYSVK